LITGKLSILGHVYVDKGYDVRYTTAMNPKVETVPFIYGTHSATDYWRTPSYTIDSDDDIADCVWITPSDLLKMTKCSIIWVANTTGNYVLGINVAFRSNSEIINANTTTTDLSLSGDTNYMYITEIPLTLFSSVVADDIVSIQATRRSGGDINVKVVGIRIEYL
jgi:hypothetical protein